MNGKIRRLYDIKKLDIPKELLSVSVLEGEADATLKNLALRYASESFVETAEKGDILYCTADEKSYPDKREIIIFTGTELPGAEKASLDGVKKTVGESFSTELFGKSVLLSVEKIIHREPCEINDDFVLRLNIEGVSTVWGAKKYFSDKLSEERKAQNIKEINNLLCTALVENSEFEYDAKEMSEYVEKVYAEALSMYGNELEGEDLGEIKASIEFSFKQGLAVKEYCKENGLIPDTSTADEEVDRMLQMMALTGEEQPPREELLESALLNGYYEQFFGFTEKCAKERMSAYGNC